MKKKFKKTYQVTVDFEDDKWVNSTWLESYDDPNEIEIEYCN